MAARTCAPAYWRLLYDMADWAERYDLATPYPEMEEDVKVGRDWYEMEAA